MWHMANCSCWGLHQLLAVQPVRDRSVSVGGDQRAGATGAWIGFASRPVRVRGTARGGAAGQELAAGELRTRARAAEPGAVGVDCRRTVGEYGLRWWQLDSVRVG